MQLILKHDTSIINRFFNHTSNKICFLFTLLNLSLLPFENLYEIIKESKTLLIFLQ